MRFGDDWIAYRRDVRDWLPRWRPTPLLPSADLYRAANCDPCSQVGSWFERRDRIRLRIVDAELHRKPLVRVRYEGGCTADGTRAIGCALEHLHLGWALIGWVMRAPLLALLIQVVADAMGAGPRTVEAR